MARIQLVRHGQAAASFTDDADPGLDKLGIDQARAVADQLRSNLPLLLISSPLKRARETAAPLLLMQVDALSSESIRIDTSHVETLPLETLHIETLHIETRMSEIPSPGLSLSDRGAWLGQVMQGQWSEQSGSLSEWRTDLISCLNEQQQDCVIFTHFVAINVAVGYAEGNDQVSIFRPGNTSITELVTDGESLTLAKRGEQAVSIVN